MAVRAFIVEFCKCMDYIQHAKMLVSGCEPSFVCCSSSVFHQRPASLSPSPPLQSRPHWLACPPSWFCI